MRVMSVHPARPDPGVQGAEARWQEMTMTRIAQQSAENMEYVRTLLSRKQPGFWAALELALALADLELGPPQLPCETSAASAK
jgi:hypothetical protein